MSDYLPTPAVGDRVRFIKDGELHDGVVAHISEENGRVNVRGPERHLYFNLDPGQLVTVEERPVTIMEAAALVNERARHATFEHKTFSHDNGGTGVVPCCEFLEASTGKLCGEPTLVGYVCYDHTVMHPKTEEPMCPLTSSLDDFQLYVTQAAADSRRQGLEEYIDARQRYQAARRSAFEHAEDPSDVLVLTDEQRAALSALRARGYQMTPIQGSPQQARAKKVREQATRVLTDWAAKRRPDGLFGVLASGSEIELTCGDESWLLTPGDAFDLGQALAAAAFTVMHDED